MVMFPTWRSSPHIAVDDSVVVSFEASSMAASGSGGTLLWLCLLLLLGILMQDVSAHLGRIYKSARALEQSGRSEGRKFPILRALVSQFISDRSARDMSPVSVVSAAAAAKTAGAGSGKAATTSVHSSTSLSATSRETASSLVDDDPLSFAPAASTNKARHAELNNLFLLPLSASSSSGNGSSGKAGSTSNVKTIQHIIEDINSQNSKISTKRRKHFLVNILSRMLKSVNFTEDDLDYIRTHTTLKHGEMCGVIFGMDCARKVTKNLNWTIAIPERKQSNNVKRSSSSSPSAASSAGAASTAGAGADDAEADLMSDIDYRDSYKSLAKLVQITDIHVDPYYEPGSEANCGEPLCCRSTNGPAKSRDRAAGPWGDYRNCDTPVPTLRHVLKHINEVHSDAEYWMWTGDVAPHDIWNVTRREVISQMKLVTGLIKQYARVPVYPVIGNHEGVPVNSFPPPEIKGVNSVSWLYDTVAEEWAFWLPEDALQTLRYGGYYTVKPRDKMRIICINTNYCARLNPWSLFNPVDPANQLKWLSDELHKAETAGDRVHIIGHIPPDNRECTQAWLYNFLRIIDRFNETILAQYYGHTHRDEYRLFYSPSQAGVPIGLAYIGPSITPFTENNPAYRLYYMDESGTLNDHETYYFNLTEANQSKRVHRRGTTCWASWKGDDKLFNEFKNIYYRHSDVKKWEKCTDKCKKYLLSDLKVLHPLKHRPKRFFGRRKHGAS
ncbi:Sphingomyelin phosphodiesterase [Tyrophagus putrescentiae]|nr:Sphingomyelin phosphodiesterase [Tyrophagus putrescentiae]